MKNTKHQDTKTKEQTETQQRSPLVVLTDLIEDPLDNGDYKISATGEQLAELWRAVEQQEFEITRLRRLAEHIASQLHFEACPCGDCLLALRAIEALGRPRPVRHHYCLIGG